MGPFLTAYLKVNGRSAKSRRQAEQWLTKMQRFIQDEGVGQIPVVLMATHHIAPAAASHKHGTLQNYSAFPWKRFE
jgi:hypothetical protein